MGKVADELLDKDNADMKDTLRKAGIDGRMPRMTEEEKKKQRKQDNRGTTQIGGARS